MEMIYISEGSGGPDDGRHRRKGGSRSKRGWLFLHPYLSYHPIGLDYTILLRILKYLRRKQSKNKKKVTF